MKSTKHANPYYIEGLFSNIDSQWRKFLRLEQIESIISNDFFFKRADLFAETKSGSKFLKTNANIKAKTATEKTAMIDAMMALENSS